MSTNPIIHVDHLKRYYDVPEREEGFGAAVRSLFHRKYRQVRAVDDISFDIDAGEVVGFLGPNGAGKTTTLKMLAGLLYTTSGDVNVLNYTPSRRENIYLRQMTMIMGNRNQLQWDIPALDSFALNRAIYNIPEKEFLQTRDEFIELLDLRDLVHKPIRNLSLGERMKMEFAGALLHRPKVLFLDEPTIGLDVTMQRRIRAFVAEYNRKYDATVLLTSHYMADVEALCKRVIVIHHGKLLFDGNLTDLSSRVASYKTIVITSDDADIDLSSYGTVIEQTDTTIRLQVPKLDVSSVAATILGTYSVLDITIEDPPIEGIIEQVFAQEAVG